MGQNLSVPANHIQIYQKIQAIQNPATKLQMIETVLSDSTIIHSAKIAGVYSFLLSTAASIRHGYAQPSSGQQGQQQGQQQQQGYIQQARNIPMIQNRSVPTNTLVVHNNAQMINPKTASQDDMYTHVAKSKRAEKALNYFTTCLRVLGIQEEVALTEETLKKAYKKSSLRAHPDRGGTKEAFDAITRAYAYLGEILVLTRGRSSKKGSEKTTNESYEDIQQVRSSDNDQYKHVEPIKLDPKNLNMKSFNQMFEQTRIPDPDEDGYGNWLQTPGEETKKGSKKFSDAFNREVFNRMFEDDNKKEHSSTQLSVFQPQELTLAPTYGVELGREKPPDFTAAPNANLKYTDLKQAYTSENTLQHQIQGARVEQREFESYRSQRERAPDQYNPSELASLQEYEALKEQREEQRRIRAAQEQVGARDYFERMKQLVITQR